MKQTLVKTLIALRDNGGELSNSELKQRTGRALTGADNAELEEGGWLTTDRGKRPLVHTLTAKGRSFEPPAAQPKPAGATRRPGPSTGLSPNQILALIALMAEARELTNKELEEAAGFALTGADNKRLESLGYVETNRSARPFTHRLSEKGWLWVRTLHTMEPPREGRSAVRTLFNLLANVDRALERLQISHGEFFKQTQTTVATLPERPEAAIRAAYAALADPPGGWVGLADLRDRLPGLDRETVDTTLRAMLDRPGVRVVPAANTKALKPRDHDAALAIGGEDSHMMAVDPS